MYGNVVVPNSTRYKSFEKFFLNKREYRGALSSSDNRLIAHYVRSLETFYTSKTFYVNPRSRDYNGIVINAEVRFGRGCIDYEVFEAGINTNEGMVRSYFILFILNSDKQIIDFIRLDRDSIDVDRGRLFPAGYGMKDQSVKSCAVSTELNLSFSCTNPGISGMVRHIGGANDVRLIMGEVKVSTRNTFDRADFFVRMDDGGEVPAYHGMLVK